MNHIQYDQYGAPNVLYVSQTKKPTIKPGHILVKTAYNSVNASDARIRAARFPRGFGTISKLIFGITKPRNKTLGGVFSGVVEQVASDVKEYKVGDRVCGMTGLKQGCYSEYILKDTSYCTAKIPDDLELDTACAILFGGTTAMYFLGEVAKLQKGENILINGASGSTGTAMVSLAKSLGANVTGVCSQSNTKLIKSLGAKKIIDYHQTPFREIEGKFDLIVDTIGNLEFDSTKDKLTENGRLVVISGGMLQQIRAGIGVRGKQKMLSGVSPERTEDVQQLLKMVQKNQIKPVISKVFSYKDIQKAHQIVDSGRKVGNILIKW